MAPAAGAKRVFYTVTRFATPQDMHGRVCVITGATSGIGRATAAALARRGATVVLVCRDPRRAASTREAIRRESSNDAVSVVLADLASLAEVRRAATEITTTHGAVHVLIHNAGVATRRRSTTADGHELTLAVNHLAPFVLTTRLVSALRAGAPSRVIVVSSRMERMGHIDFDNIHVARGYSLVRAYSQSKLANVLFTYELAGRLAGTGVTVNCLHPGLVATNLLHEIPSWMRALYTPFLHTVEQGARAPVRLATAPELERVSGRYFGDPGIETRSSRRSYDVVLRRRLWDVSEQLTGERW